MTAHAPSEEAAQLVLDAFEEGVRLGAIDERFAKLAKYSVQLVGLELARNVRPGERRTFCVPVQVATGAKVEPGALLLLEHRLVVAWSEGVLRPQDHSVACALSEVSDIRSFKRKTGRLSDEQDAISFSAGGRRVELVLYSTVSHQRLTMMIGGVLNGAITPVYEYDATVAAAARDRAAFLLLQTDE